MDTTTLLDLWNTRPVRRRHGKSVGGVCTGIGMRYRIDPTLVKVAFVVAALFGGSGIVLYIACLVLLPAEDETAPRQLKPHTQRHFKGLHEIPWYWVVLTVIAVVVLGSMGSSSPFWGSSGLLGLVLMLGGWWLLYMRTPQAPAGTSADQLRPAGTPPGVALGAAVPAPVNEYPPITVPTPTTVVPPTTPLGPTPPLGPIPPSAPTTPPVSHRDDDAPPAWDPLGAAPFAWDLPEPTPPPKPPAPKPQRSPLTSIFAGLALIVASVATAARVVGGVEWFTVGRIAALALVVLGIGMLVDSLQRRRPNSRASGLVPLAVIVGVVAVLATLFAAGRPALPSGGIGERNWHPQGVEQLSSEYALSIGTSVLDLSDVGPLDRDRTVTVRQGIGDITVILPNDVRVKTTCTTTIGDQTCPDGVLNADAKTPILTVDATLSIGTVEMKQ
ncbi:PspC domain-containing protein [Gordonia hydrophobica]|uniref:PspC domain-containing protein n=1 Tax=Gordonia hydrophobica TaxID=40516 RepID=A0ABZ2U253_9ACTN|nr:PspC domain-containing protein [Gordonia hydrophobica]MBM7366751.1 phage shock protein PspC (stress-responsive transcriptional regulator) [Gordonia hydrophobica]